LGTRFRPADPVVVPVVLAQVAGDRTGDGVVVVDGEQDRRVGHRRTLPAADRYRDDEVGRSAAAGSHIVTVVPTPSVLRMSRWPSCWATRPSTCARPSPVPWPAAFVEKKGSSTRGRTSGAIPVPVSQNSIRTQRPGAMPATGARRWAGTSSPKSRISISP